MATLDRVRELLPAYFFADPLYRNLAIEGVHRASALEHRDLLARLDADRRSRDLQRKIDDCVDAARRFNQRWF
jgi:hypothetical protein